MYLWLMRSSQNTLLVALQYEIAIFIKLMGDKKCTHYGLEKQLTIPHYPRIKARNFPSSKRTRLDTKQTYHVVASLSSFATFQCYEARNKRIVVYVTSCPLRNPRLSTTLLLFNQQVPKTCILPLRNNI